MTHNKKKPVGYTRKYNIPGPISSTQYVSIQPGNVLYSWSEEEGYLELDISPDIAAPSNGGIVSKEKVAFKNYGNYPIRITFFKGNSSLPYPESDLSGNLGDGTECNTNTYFNQNLGYYLGYRIEPVEDGSISIIIPPSAADASGNLTDENKIFKADTEKSFSYIKDNITNLYGVDIDYKNFGIINYPNSTGINWVIIDASSGTTPTPYPITTDKTYLFPNSMPVRFFSYYNGQTISNVVGPQYFLLVIDDFNQNRINSGLVAIANRETKLAVPTYAYGSYTRETIGGTPFRCVEDPVTGTSTIVKNVSNPPVLTKAQRYTVNQILNNRRESKERPEATNNSNILALIRIPLSLTQTSVGISLDFLTDVFERVYFGPVSLERLEVQLLDDMGNIVNLHDRNWSFVLTATQLYQY